jgi:hypothetical protein
MLIHIVILSLNFIWNTAFVCLSIRFNDELSLTFYLCNFGWTFFLLFSYQTPKGLVINIALREIEHAVCLSVCPSVANRLPNYQRCAREFGMPLKSMTQS